MSLTSSPTLRVALAQLNP
ncbi:hypothetical protein KIPB_003323, partial [Kipferlia bialata]|eukprot:g3323.t1